MAVCILDKNTKWDEQGHSGIKHIYPEISVFSYKAKLKYITIDLII